MQDEDVDASMAEYAPFVAIRRDLHAHPEIAFHEHRTAEIVARSMESWGIEVHRGVGRTGVVGVLRNGAGGRSVGLRADIDALPITEANTFAHASRHAGRMHACGHDGHTAMLLAAAHRLATTRRFDGVVHFVFQPAEEGGDIAGATSMIRDGLFERFPMEAIFGAHNWPGLPAGTFATCPGPMMGSCNEFTIEIRGRGAHAAMPDLARDPVPAACQIALACQTIVSRSLPPREPAVVSVTNVHAGETHHVIPEVAVLKGSVRTFSNAVTNLVEQRLQEIAQHTCNAYGLTCSIEFVRACGPTINHPAETRFLQETLAGLVGADRMRTFEPTMAAEDFSFMLAANAGCYFMIGNGDGAHRSNGHGLGPCTLHNPSYDFNDELIPVGAAAWVAIAERWLAAA